MNSTPRFVPDRVGIVVIGRNEAQRLKNCLESLFAGGCRIVYVDSGSTDGSVGMALELDIESFPLDPATPFTAARARNEGFRQLRAKCPELDYVQFVDGDCEISAGWLEAGARYLDVHSSVAAVCGRLREKFPMRSVYNMLCDIEWDAPTGDTDACGGIAMMRVKSFEEVGGFRTDLIAGEEPELCVRLRSRGWTVFRLEAEMALHDAAMFRFRQWWKRMMRGGYSFAQGAAIHGAPPERHRIRESRSAWVWGMGLPVLFVVLAIAWGPRALILFFIYPMQVIRLALRGTRTSRENWWHAGFLVLGKFPEMLGQLKYLLHRSIGKPGKLIEHKLPSSLDIK